MFIDKSRHTQRVKFTEIKPSNQLQSFVQCFWWMELDCENEASNFRERVLPDGSTEIIFHLGENVSRINVDGSLQSEPNSLFIGQNTQSYQITANGSVKMFGIKFFAHTISFLTQEEASQFKDKTVDLSDIFGSSAKNLYERIRETKNLASQIMQVENFLCNHLQNKKSFQFAYLDFAIQRIIKGKGQANLSEIIQKLGVSARYLEKLFLEYVGISPKTFAQIVQLQNSVRLLTSNENLSLTDISYASGYYDQSHFIHAVKRFTGLTPSQLKNEKMPMQQPFFDSAKI